MNTELPSNSLPSVLVPSEVDDDEAGNVGVDEDRSGEAVVEMSGRSVRRMGPPRRMDDLEVAVDVE